jgi:hypothetical protein
MRVKENRNIRIIVSVRIFFPKDGFPPHRLYSGFDSSPTITPGWLFSVRFYPQFVFFKRHSLSGRRPVK